MLIHNEVEQANSIMSYEKDNAMTSALSFNRKFYDAVHAELNEIKEFVKDC